MNLLIATLLAAVLQPPAGQKPYLTAHAVGVQVYSCTAAGWTFVAPRADLYGTNGKLVARHYAGPTWEARDGSRVVGTVLARSTVDPSAIPWLLLAATSTTPGRFESTTYIQRLDTTGGLAPSGACSAGSTTEVPYTADYAFWKEME